MVLPIRQFVDYKRSRELDDERWEDVSEQHSLRRKASEVSSRAQSHADKS